MASLFGQMLKEDREVKAYDPRKSALLKDWERKQSYSDPYASYPKRVAQEVFGKMGADLKDRGRRYIEDIKHPIKRLDQMVDVVPETAKVHVEESKRLASEMAEMPTLKEKVAALPGLAYHNVVRTFLTPISMIFGMAEKVPVLGRGLEDLMDLAGSGIEAWTDKATDPMPYESEAASTFKKTFLKPLFQDALMVTLFEGLGKYGKRTGKYVRRQMDIAKIKKETGRNPIDFAYNPELGNIKYRGEEFNAYDLAQESIRVQAEIRQPSEKLGGVSIVPPSKIKLSPRETVIREFLQLYSEEARILGRSLEEPDFMPIIEATKQRAQKMEEINKRYKDVFGEDISPELKDALDRIPEGRLNEVIDQLRKEYERRATRQYRVKEQAEGVIRYKPKKSEFAERLKEERMITKKRETLEQALEKYPETLKRLGEDIRAMAETGMTQPDIISKLSSKPTEAQWNIFRDLKASGANLKRFVKEMADTIVVPKAKAPDAKLKKGSAEDIVAKRAVEGFGPRDIEIFEKLKEIRQRPQFAETGYPAMKADKLYSKDVEYALERFKAVKGIKDEATAFRLIDEFPDREYYRAAIKEQDWERLSQEIIETIIWEKPINKLLTVEPSRMVVEQAQSLLGKLEKEQPRMISVIKRTMAKQKGKVEFVERAQEAIRSIRGISTKMRPEFKSAVKQLVGSFKEKNKYGQMIKGVNVKIKGAKKLAEEMAKLRSEGEEIMFPPELDAKLAGFEGKKVGDLTIENLELLARAAKHIQHVNKNKNTLISGQEMLILSKSVEYMTIDMKAARRLEKDLSQYDKEPEMRAWLGKIKDWHDLVHYNPQLVTEIMSGKDGGTYDVAIGGPKSMMREYMYGIPDKGVDAQLKHSQNMTEIFTDFNKNGAVKDNWSYYFGKKPEMFEYSLDSGQKLRLTKGDRVSLYRHYGHMANRRSLLNEGFALDRLKTVEYAVTSKDMDNIINDMTDAEKLVADEPMEKIMKLSGDAIAPVYLELNGIEFERVDEGYWPMEPLEKTGITLNKFQQFTLGSQGFLIPRVPWAKTKLLLRDAFVVMNNAIEGSATYAGIGKAVRDMRLILRDKTFKKSVVENFGNKWFDYLKRWADDFEGSSISNITDIDKMALSIKDKFQIGAIGNNPFTAMIQPASLMSALTEPTLSEASLSIGMKRVMGNPKKIAAKWTARSPQTLQRFNRGFNKEIYEMTSKMILRKKFLGKSTFDEGQMWLLQKGDQFAILSIFEGIEHQMKMKHNMTDANLITKIAEENINRTQLSAQPKDRSSLSRNKSIIAKTITLFTSATNAMSNSIGRVTARFLREKNPKNFALLVKSLIYITVGTSFIISTRDAIRSWWYGKEWTVDNYLKDLPGNVASVFYGVSGLVDSIKSKIERGTFAGWDPSNMFSDLASQFTDSIADMYHLVDRAIKGEEINVWKTVKNAAILASYMTGIGLQAPLKLIEGGVKKVRGENDEEVSDKREWPESTTKRTWPESKSRKWGTGKKREWPTK